MNNTFKKYLIDWHIPLITIMKVFLSILFIFSTLTVAMSVFSDPGDRPVRIISWWEHFTDQGKIKEIEDLCNVEIEPHEYFLFRDFKSMIKTSSYDIYIYPGTAIKEMPEYLPLNSPDISDLTDDYYPVNKKR